MTDARAAGALPLLPWPIASRAVLRQLAIEHLPPADQYRAVLQWHGSYYERLKGFHEQLEPDIYLEIGVEKGNSLAVARPRQAAIGVDPELPTCLCAKLPDDINVELVSATSDEFFATHAPVAIDLAFIDGLHLFEQALLDFINVERWCSSESTVLVHDCVPPDPVTASRERETAVWSGDVWKLIPCLRAHRPDLEIEELDIAPTGMAVIRNLDPSSSVLRDRYSELLDRYIPLDFAESPVGRAQRRAESPSRSGGKAGVIAFGVCVGDDDRYQRIALPALRALGVHVIERREQTSIAHAYNSILREARELRSLEALVLIHEDVEMRDAGIGERLRTLFADPSIGIVGAVGAANVDSIEWWEYSRVGHVREAHRNLVFASGTQDAEVVDGLLIAMSPWAVSTLEFDEVRFSGFHGYDADICAQARAAGRRVVVTDLDVIHWPRKKPDESSSFRAADDAWRKKWKPTDSTPVIRAYMTTSTARDVVRTETLERLAATDWGDDVTLVFDDCNVPAGVERQQRMARRLIESAVDDGVDLILYLEDDIDFNRHLRANILSWPPVTQFRSGDHFYASLFNVDAAVKLRRPEDRCFVARPESVKYSQALIVSAATARAVLQDWELVPGFADVRMSRLAAHLTPILYHEPSLVQHLPYPSLSGMPFEQAADFSRDWRAPNA